MTYRSVRWRIHFRLLQPKTQVLSPPRSQSEGFIPGRSSSSHSASIPIVEAKSWVSLLERWGFSFSVQFPLVKQKFCLDAMCWEHWDPDCPCPDLWGNCCMPEEASLEDSRLLAAPSLIHQGAQFLLWDFYSDRLLPLCLPSSLEPLHRGYA